MIETMDLVLTGARAGKTVKLNGKQFVGGVLRLRGSHDQLEPVASYYGRAYAAFPAGSKALIQAQKRDALAKEHGKSHSDPDAKPGTTNVVSRASTDGHSGQDQTPASSTQHEGSDGSEAGSEGIRAGGSGHTDAGIRSGQVTEQQQSNANGDLNRIRDAVMLLDPDVAENWTDDGKPSVNAVAEAANDPSITRKQIDAAAGDWTRGQASAKKKSAGE